MLTKAVRALGELLITSGLVVLLFVAYVLWGTGVQTSRAQNAAVDKLEEAWDSGTVLPGESEGDELPGTPSSVPAASASPSTSSSTSGSPSPSRSSSAPTAAARPPAPSDIPIGTGLARLRIPRFGADYQWVIGEGVSQRNLKDGPGHYPGTALPGQVGNFVVSGHRTTYGAPFGGAAELESGDAIIVETAKNWYTYRVREREIVDPTRIGVTLPVPNKPGVEPTERLMTLTTCHPKFSAKQRLILYAVLEVAQPKAPGFRPAALGPA